MINMVGDEHRVPGRDSQPAGFPRHKGLSDGGVLDPLAGDGLKMGQKPVG
jgi:hypothetical protein